MDKVTQTRNPLETLILDFYAMVGFNTSFVHPDEAGFLPVETDADVAFNVSQSADAAAIKERVITAIKELFIRDVYFSLCCEVRHLTGHADLNPEPFFEKHFGSLGRQWFKVFSDVYCNEGAGKSLLSYKTPKPDPAFQGCYVGYLHGYFSVLIAEENTGLPLHKICEKIFDPALVNWEEFFGGQKWLDITRAYMSLLAANDTWEIIRAIDVLVAIEHNTATVFNKLEYWVQDNEFEWLARVLDVKFQARTPFSFIAMCSPDVQRVYRNLRRLENILKDRSRYREDFAGEQHEEEYLDESAVERQVLIRNLTKDEVLILDFKGAERVFLLDSAYRGKSQDGSFVTYVLKACGWGLPKNENRVTKYFSFSERELLDCFVRVSDGKEFLKARDDFVRWVNRVYEQFFELLKKSDSGLCMGTCLVDKGEGQGRFRIYKLKQEDNRTIVQNVRIYFTLEEYKYVVLRFGVTPKAFNLAQQVDMATILTRLGLDDPIDKIADTALSIVHEILQEAHGDFVDPQIFAPIIKYLEGKSSK